MKTETLKIVLLSAAAALVCSGCQGKRTDKPDVDSAFAGNIPSSSVSFTAVPAGSASSSAASSQPGSLTAGASATSLPGKTYALKPGGGSKVPAVSVSAIRATSSKPAAKSTPPAAPSKVPIPSGSATDYPYGEIPVSQWSTRIKNITSDQLKAIPKNTSYKDIIAKFGDSVAHFLLPSYFVYSVDNSKLLLLNSVENNGICPLSGEELLAQAATVNSKYDSRSVSFCIAIEKPYNHYLSVINPICQFGGPYSLHYYELSIDENAKIIFENGKPATMNDIRFNQGLAVTCYGAVKASIPAHVHVNQIRILQ